MIKRFGLWCLLLLCAQLIAPATYASENKSNSIKNERIIEAFEDNQNIWYRNAKGHVGRYSISTNKISKPYSESYFVDLATSDGNLLGLKKSGTSKQLHFEVLNIKSGKILSPRLKLSKNHPLVMAVNDVHVFVVSSKSVSALNMAKSKQKWKTLKLRESLRQASQMSAVVTPRGRIYFGQNKGEWGGGLRLIDPQTGAVKIIQEERPGDCGILLYPGCDPITSIISHPWKPDCIIAAMGLSHFFTRGAIVTVCDGKITDVYRKSEIKIHENGQYTYELPFFDLVETNDGWVAATYGQLVQNDNGKITEISYPEFTNSKGMAYSRMENDLFVITSDVNWGMSLSGITPLLVRKIK